MKHLILNIVLLITIISPSSVLAESGRVDDTCFNMDFVFIWDLNDNDVPDGGDEYITFGVGDIHVEDVHGQIFGEKFILFNKYNYNTTMCIGDEVSFGMNGTCDSMKSWLYIEDVYEYAIVLLLPSTHEEYVCTGEDHDEQMFIPAIQQNIPVVN